MSWGVCEKNKTCTRNSKLKTLNITSFPGQILCPNYVGRLPGKYLITNVDSMSHVVQVDVCSEASGRETSEGVQ